MRTRASLVALVATGVWAASALAASPAQIYNQYVATGHLSCSYSRGELEAVLRSGSINQYGDPLTLTRIKLAARRHLAGSCQTHTTPTSATTTSTTGSGGASKHQKRSKGRQTTRHSKQQKRSKKRAAGLKPSTSGSSGSFVAGRALIIGLLALALAFGGWLTKRALSARD